MASERLLTGALYATHFNLERNTIAEIEILNGVDVLLQTLERERDVTAALNEFHVAAHPLAINNVNHRLLEIHTKIGEIAFAVHPVLVRFVAGEAAMPDEHVAKILEFFEV